MEAEEKKGSWSFCRLEEICLETVAISCSMQKKTSTVVLLLDKLHEVYVDQRKSDDVERSNLRSENNVHDKVKALSRRATTSPHIPTIQKNQ